MVTTMHFRHVPPILAIAVGLGLSSCGSDGGDATQAGPSAGNQPAGADDETGPFAYAQCMRDHGLDFPDPQVSADGGVRITPGSGNDPNDPKVQEAQDTCQPLLQQGNRGAALDEDQLAEQQEAALAFGECMRNEGITNVPDPEVNSNGGVTGRPGQGVDPNSPEFQDALAACESEMPRPGGQP